MNFPQLRVRTEFSFRQAFGPVNKVAAALAEIGCPAAGIVDGGTWGHVRWSKACEKVGVKPLFGTEIAITMPDGRKPTAWALAEDTRLFYNFSTAIRSKGLPPEKMIGLFAESRGIIRFAGAALTEPDTFDYIDLNPASAMQQKMALNLHRRTGKPMVVTSDNSYPTKNDYAAFMAIIARERVTPQHLLSIEELRASMRMLDDQQFNSAVNNTIEVAERCASKLPVAPIIHIPGDLRAMAEEGKQRRLALGHISEWTQEYEDRLQRELKAIEDKQYESYFFVVADLVQWAKTKMLVGPGRGSSSGSLFCYLVGITEVDSIKHHLLFERFIDLTRKDLPDIDIDFCDSKRELCFEYLARKYGTANVARIGNVNTLKPRSVMNEVCKRFAIPLPDKFKLLDVLAEYSTGDSRFGNGIYDTLHLTDNGKEFLKKFPEAAVMCETENHAWHTGVHAAGVIVSNEPVSDYCTVGPDGVAQIDKPDAEALNLLKIDALGLRTLGIIEDAGVVTADELYALKMDDPKVLSIFNQKKYSCIFQFEGATQRIIAEQVDMDSFRTIDHITALARPGPLGGGATEHYTARKAGREPVTYRHPKLEPVLKDTYGVVLYQEQVMNIVREIGHFSWEDTTIIRKAMSARKGKEFFDRKGELFVEGAKLEGVNAEGAALMWQELCDFGAWGMNACAHKDTRIKLAHPNQFLGPDPTIEALHQYYKVNPSRWVKQQRTMPIVLALGQDGRAKPTMALDIHKNGPKPCVRLTFTDGKIIECTLDHKFIINGEWRPCKDATAGSEFTSVTRDHASNDRRFNKTEQGKNWMKGRKWAGGDHPRLNGKASFENKFKKLMKGKPCVDCGGTSSQMEAHHNDFNGGNDRPEDLAWLCNSCHKLRHITYGDRRGPYARGWMLTEPAILLEVEDIGVHETYDIEMPEPNHNYVLANGIVTHNSHTCAYAMISYYCAWLKAYHPVAFAAACLRHAKDDPQSLEILREMVSEGVEYIPFDIDLSEAHWSVKNNKLIGGFRNLIGFGPAKSAAAIEARRNGKMTEKLRNQIMDAHVKFTELYPITTKFADVYSDPGKYGFPPGSHIVQGNELPPRGPVYHITKVLAKSQRDENETLRIAKRNGVRFGDDGSPTQFIDLHCMDDSGAPITLRVDRFRFEKPRSAKHDEPFGPWIMQNVHVGDVVLIKGSRIPNFSLLKVNSLLVLNNEWLIETPRLVEERRAASGTKTVRSLQNALAARNTARAH
jgi:hypothetical protein